MLHKMNVETPSLDRPSASPDRRCVNLVASATPPADGGESRQKDSPSDESPQPVGSVTDASPSTIPCVFCGLVKECFPYLACSIYRLLQLAIAEHPASTRDVPDSAYFEVASSSIGPKDGLVRADDRLNAAHVNQKSAHHTLSQDDAVASPVSLTRDELLGTSAELPRGSLKSSPGKGNPSDGTSFDNAMGRTLSNGSEDYQATIPVFGERSLPFAVASSPSAPSKSRASLGVVRKELFPAAQVPSSQNSSLVHSPHNAAVTELTSTIPKYASI